MRAGGSDDERRAGPEKMRPRGDRKRGRIRRQMLPAVTFIVEKLEWDINFV